MHHSAFAKNDPGAFGPYRLVMLDLKNPNFAASAP